MGDAVRTLTSRGYLYLNEAVHPCSLSFLYSTHFAILALSVALGFETCVRVDESLRKIIFLLGFAKVKKA